MNEMILACTMHVVPVLVFTCTTFVVRGGIAACRRVPLTRRPDATHLHGFAVQSSGVARQSSGVARQSSGVAGREVVLPCRAAACRTEQWFCLANHRDHFGGRCPS